MNSNSASLESAPRVESTERGLPVIIEEMKVVVGVYGWNRPPPVLSAR